jgi:NAD(P)H-hydrate epimerase
MKVLTAEEMRQVDRLTSEREGIPSATLMENAGARVARFIASRFSAVTQRTIVILCGKGNNGGDGFVVARHLRAAGAAPNVYLFAAPEEMRGDAAENYKRWKDLSASLHVVRTSSECKK